MTINRFEHGGNIYAAHSAFSGTLLDFSANINPFGLSSLAEQAIKDNIKLVEHYPDPHARELRREICRCYRVPDERLVLGNGAAELLYLLCSVLRPSKVLIPAPSFSEYERAALSVDAQIERVILSPADDFALSFSKLAEVLEEDMLVFLGHPNNPTGKLLDRKSVTGFLEAAERKNSHIVIDESFIDFLPDGDKHTCRWLAESYENLHVIHSLTKFFAIPGLRLGFGLFPPEMAEKLKKATDCWNVNTLAQIAGVAALRDEHYIKIAREEIGGLRDRFSEKLSAMPGVQVFPSSANFLLLYLSGQGCTAAKLCARMAEKGILMRDCSNYVGLDDRYIRVAVKSEEENKRFIDIFAKEINNG